jgi:hypothetical protein
MDRIFIGPGLTEQGFMAESDLLQAETGKSVFRSRIGGNERRLTQIN